MKADARFLSQHRIRHSGDFRRAYERRCSSADRQIVVFGHSNGLDHPRLGLSVSRRVGGAVLRNRWKRLIREAFRLSRDRLPVGIDLIVLPRPGVEPTLAALLESLPRLASRVARKVER